MRSIPVYLLASAAAILAVGAASAETWLKDPITGCEIWSDGTSGASEAATWSGACHDGKADGRGYLVWQVDGELIGTYDGEMRGGRLHGEGDLKLRNDAGTFDRYTGQFADGEPRGDGTIVTAEGWKLVGTFEGSFDNAKGIAFYETEEGALYLGDVEDNKRNGVAVLPDVPSAAVCCDVNAA